ncbi:hypothetical protein P775_00780 [Puniceibacterium antarcticum]|uniref:Uncharacterized protein n=1 Tax=Puniceibacterium antarcticum TaxID=1206336 RepID=A0A2G8RKE4_9RHOB|nr:hypothetical protein P775_00780 [Puniceibacterium antarcticum]
MSGEKASKAKAVIGPTPGRVCRRFAVFSKLMCLLGPRVNAHCFFLNLLQQISALLARQQRQERL